MEYRRNGRIQRLDGVFRNWWRINALLEREKKSRIIFNLMFWTIVGALLFTLVIIPLLHKVLLMDGRWKWTFSIIGIAIIVIIIGFGISFSLEKRQEKISKGLIKVENLSFEDVKLTGYDNSYEISGIVTNSSVYNLTDFKMVINAYDCIDSKCSIIGEENYDFYVTIPPSQKRQFNGYLSFSGMPSVSELTWDYKVVEITGKINP